MIPMPRLLELLSKPESATPLEREYLVAEGVKKELEFAEMSAYYDAEWEKMQAAGAPTQFANSGVHNPKSQLAKGR